MMILSFCVKFFAFHCDLKLRIWNVEYICHQLGSYNLQLNEQLEFVRRYHCSVCLNVLKFQTHTQVSLLLVILWTQIDRGKTHSKTKLIN